MAEGTATHHVIHLKEFAERESIASLGFGHNSVSGMHFFAFMIVKEADMIKVRDALKPHRAELAD